MSNSPDLSSLIARVEAATGPDPALEGRIYAALFGGTASQDCPEPTRRSYSGQAYFTNTHLPCVLIDDTHHAEPVTASLDAALALVERIKPGWFWRVGHTVLYDGWAHIARADGSNTTPGVDEFSGTAKTPALALILALLRALQAQASESNRKDGSETKTNGPSDV